MAQGAAQPLAREAAAHVAGRRRRARSGLTLFVPLTAAIYVLIELQGIHPLRKPVPFLPVLVGGVLMAHPRAARRHLKIPLALAAFIGWVAVSYFWTPDKYGVAAHTVEFLALALSGWMVGTMLTREQLVRAYAAATRVIIAITGVSLIVAYHWAVKPAVDGAPGWHGPVGHKNELGFLMAIGLISLWFERPRGRRWAAWLVAGVIVLLGSESGAGLAVVAIGGAIAVWEGTVRHAAKGAERRLVALGSWVLVLGGAVLGITDFPAATSLLGKNSTLTGRTTIWRAVWHAISTRPWIGFGFGGVWLSTAGETARIWNRIGFAVYEAHDAWLDLLIQVGVIGLALAVVFLARVLHRGWPGFRYGTPADRWAWLIVVAFLLESTVESALFAPGIFTLAAIATTLEQRPPSPRPSPGIHASAA